MSSLTPEERQRIYNEEKARIEARGRLQAEADASAQAHAKALQAQEAADRARGAPVVWIALIVLGILLVNTFHGSGAGALAMLAVAALYVLPSVIAVRRHPAAEGTAIVINLLLGWTVIGWVVAMAMAFGPTRKNG